MKTHHVPEWMERFVKKAMQTFFLDAWIVNLYTHDDPTKPEGNESADGLASFTTRYMKANLYLDDRLEPDQYGCEVLMHEVLHPVFGQMSDVVNHIISCGFPPETQFKYQGLYEGVEERIITTLARGMSRAFDLKQWADDTPAEEKVIDETDMPF